MTQGLIDWILGVIQIIVCRPIGNLIFLIVIELIKMILDTSDMFSYMGYMGDRGFPGRGLHSWNAISICF